MVRWTVIGRWTPEKYPDIGRRFVVFAKGQAPPEVLAASQKIKDIVWEFPSYYGQPLSVWVGEGEEADISTFLRYWMDLMTFEIYPSVPLETMKKLLPP